MLHVLVAAAWTLTLLGSLGADLFETPGKRVLFSIIVTSICIPILMYLACLDVLGDRRGMHFDALSTYLLTLDGRPPLEMPR